ncbi:MAG: chitobiase/beta-hexosaminidase C-terminal domain-containing protein, partial [Synergistaceae bacterium]|nr:chitobiase/beta-hexosaminidase C-terminal domain-containing protein [Synergistaceae bacterium]
MTIKATYEDIGWVFGNNDTAPWVWSDILQRPVLYWEFTAATPTASPPGGAYASAQTVALSCTTPGATIYYTLDGTDPKTSGTKQTYSTLITVPIGTTLKAYAKKAGMIDSAVLTEVYTPTVPGTPTGVSATAGNRQAAVSFTAPASDGGSAIMGYTVTSSPGNITKTGTSSPITVTGLSNGTAYTFTVTAKNSIGTGPASAPSAAVTPTASQSPPPTDKTLQSIIVPAAITGLPNGTAKTAAALGLPSTVALATNGGNISAGVAWKVADCSYNPALSTAQAFTVDGTITLPSGVANPKGLALAVRISVAVAAAIAVDPNNNAAIGGDPQ